MQEQKTKKKRGGPAKLVTATLKESVLDEIQKLDGRGFTQHEIVKRLTVVKLNQSNVCKYLKVIRERYKTQVIEGRGEKVAKMLVQLADVRAEAWKSYEESKKDSERLVRESVKPYESEETKGKKNSKGATGRRGESAEASLVLLKEIVTTEGRLPANVYLQTVLDTLKAERELLGLDAPKEVDLTARIATLSFDDLIRDQLNVVESNDPVESEIAAIEAQIPRQEENDEGAAPVVQ